MDVSNIREFFQARQSLTNAHDDVEETLELAAAQRLGA